MTCVFSSLRFPRSILSTWSMPGGLLGNKSAGEHRPMQTVTENVLRKQTALSSGGETDRDPGQTTDRGNVPVTRLA